MQSAEAASVRLGGLDRQSQAQLDGFKFRALRSDAPSQRHLYVTAWCALNVQTRGGTALVLGYEATTTEYKCLAPRASCPDSPP